MESGFTAFQADGPRDVLDGNLVLAHLVRKHAEKMNRIDLIRLDRKDLPIDLLGGLQPAALMVLDGKRQGCGDFRHNINTLINFGAIPRPAG